MSFMDKTTESKTTQSSSKTISLGGQHLATGTYGWICPVCGRGVAPDQKYCSCRPQVYPTYPTYPIYPYWWYRTTCSPASDISNLKSTYTTTDTSTKVEV